MCLVHGLAFIRLKYCLTTSRAHGLFRHPAVGTVNKKLGHKAAVSALPCVNVHKVMQVLYFLLSLLTLQFLAETLLVNPVHEYQDDFLVKRL